MTDFQEKVYSECRKIPRGRVSTYFLLAAALGKPGAARAVGNALNRNRSNDVPCHRVVKSDMSVGGYAHGTDRKIAILRSEGVKIVKGKVEPSALIRKARS